MSPAASGGRIGPKLAQLMHDARVAAAGRTIPLETEHRARYHKAFMEEMESGLGERARAVFTDVMDNPDMPEEVRAMFRPLLGPEHQSDFLFGVFVLIGAVFTLPGAAAAGLGQEARNESLRKRPTVPLTPSELALMVVRGVTDEASGANEAQFSGLTHDRFRMLMEITGEPIALQEALLLYRRGLMDDHTLERLIRQSRIRNEWIPFAKELRYAPPGAGQVIAAAVEGHLSEGEAAHRLSEAGIDPANFHWLYETAGRPPGTQEMIQLWRRGEVSEAEVTSAIRESDVKNKYIPAILKMRRHIPPPRSVVAMLRHGSIDDGVARQMLAAGGVEGADADAMIRDGHHQATTNMRQLAAGEIVTAYTDGILDRGAAQSHLETIRYSGEDAETMLAVADLRRERRYIESAIGRVRSTYVGHHITRDKASVALDSLAVPATQRDHLIHLWDLERGANVKMLTEAQVAKAAKQGLIENDEFKRRLLALGYTDADADLLVALQNPAPTTGSLGP